MEEYSINVRKDGTAVIARNFWNTDHSLEALENKPFLFEVGQKVVDIFSNIVTIKEMNSYIAYIKSHKLKSGDKVKIIIVKED